MNSKEILSITKCGDLFPNNEEYAKLKYKELAKKYHPDVSKEPNADSVFAKITELYNKALSLIKKGEWEKTNYILISNENGKKIALNYDTFFEFELGICYVTKTKIVYILDSDKEKYFKNAIKRIKSLSYADKKMEDDLSRFFPKIHATFKTNENKYVLVLNKTEDVYPLKTVLEYFNNKIDDKHVAWIISRLCHLTCYLKYSGLVHNGININNCFVSPDYHSILLLGGWWYTTKENESMIGTTKDIFSIMSITAKSNKKSSTVTDLESVKLLGRQLLGETNCRKLVLDNSISKSMVNYLISGSSDNSYEEFAKWDKALENAFGKRRFIKMEIEDIYKG